MAGAYKIINVCTTSFEELSEKAAELNSEIANSQSKMDSYTSKLDEVDQKIKDIQNLGTLSFTDKQELENLQNQRQELENLYNIEKARHDLAQSDLEKTLHAVKARRKADLHYEWYQGYQRVGQDG